MTIDLTDQEAMLLLIFLESDGTDDFAADVGNDQGFDGEAVLESLIDKLRALSS